MDIRQKMLNILEQLSDEQLAILLPLAQSMLENQTHDFSNQTSHAYQDWVGAENDIYDEIFTDEVAAR